MERQGTLHTRISADKADLRQANEAWRAAVRRR